MTNRDVQSKRDTHKPQGTERFELTDCLGMPYIAGFTSKSQPLAMQKKFSVQTGSAMCFEEEGKTGKHLCILYGYFFSEKKSD